MQSSCKLSTLWSSGLKMQSSTWKLGVHLQSLLECPTVLLKKAEWKWTPYFHFQECRVCLNSPLCFYRMQSSYKPPHLQSLLELLICFYKMQSSNELPTGFSKNAEISFNSPLCIYKMQSPLEVPTVQWKNAEFLPTPHSVFTKCAVHLNPPLCFLTMQSLLEHPILLSKNAELKQTPHCITNKLGHGPWVLCKPLHH